MSSYCKFAVNFNVNFNGIVKENIVVNVNLNVNVYGSPTAWHMMQKSLAIGGGMVKPRVMTGKAMTPPPMEVIPPDVAPKMVMIDSR
jgi:hypothetical protein